MSEINDLINEKRNSHLLLLNTLKNKGVDIQDLAITYNIYQKYETGMKDRKIHFFDYFKNKDNLQHEQYVMASFQLFKLHVNEALKDIRKNNLLKMCKNDKFSLDDKFLSSEIDLISELDVPLDLIKKEITSKIKGMDSVRQLAIFFKRYREQYIDDNFTVEKMKKVASELGATCLVNDNKLFIEIDNFKQAELLGTAAWCISREQGHFKKEIEYGIYRFIIEYDFDKDLKNNLSLKALKLNSNGKVMEVWDRYNNKIDNFTSEKEYKFEPIEKSILLNAIYEEYAKDPTYMFIIHGLYEEAKKQENFKKSLNYSLSCLNKISNLDNMESYIEELKNNKELIEKESIREGIVYYITLGNFKDLLSIIKEPDLKSEIENDTSEYFNLKFLKYIKNNPEIKEKFENSEEPLIKRLFAANIYYIFEENLVSKNTEKEILETLRVPNVFFNMEIYTEELLTEIIRKQKENNWKEKDIYEFFEKHLLHSIYNHEDCSMKTKQIHYVLKQNLENYELYREQLSKKVDFEKLKTNNNLTQIPFLKLYRLSDKLELLNIKELPNDMKGFMKNIIIELKDLNPAKEKIVNEIMEKYKINLELNKIKPKI